jgi:hypothetical protein
MYVKDVDIYTTCKIKNVDMHNMAGAGCGYTQHARCRMWIYTTYQVQSVDIHSALGAG